MSVNKRRTFFFDGLPVSRGVVIGPAFVLESHDFKVRSFDIDEEDLDNEISRFHTSVENARKELEELAKSVREKIDSQQAAIFDAHVTILSDPHLIEQTTDRIRKDRRNAEFVFWNIAKKIGDQLQALGDSTFSERTHDLYDVARRVLKFLDSSRGSTSNEIPEGAIIVASDLGPSETAHFHNDKIAGIATDSGGPTSHTAIMAKALSLPAVVGLDFLTHYVRTGNILIIDGSEGKVILNPSPSQVEFYEERAEEFRKVRENLDEIINLPSQTLDGELVHLEANIEFTHELTMVKSQGAEGIGLYRTEYLFIDRTQLPSEEEQEVAYRKVVDEMGDAPVVFRTLDVGGDKLTTSIPIPREGNPFLGLRAIRLCLAYPELFRTQLRPLLRAAEGRELHLLLPMISGVDEVKQAKEIVFDVKKKLKSKNLPTPKDIKFGAMIEIPSAVLQADFIAEEVDFFSIGTNDLIQYTIAVDRVNKLVGSLYKETHPAVLKLIKQVVEVGKKNNVPVTVCGEMAGEPTLALLLVGLGVRRLSMSPALIGLVKKSIRGVEASFLTTLASELLQLPSPGEVQRRLIDKLLEHQSSTFSKQS